MARGAPKTRLIGVRMSVDDAEALRRQMTESGLKMSELIRRRIKGQVVVSRTEKDTARSVDQLGRMLRYFYPKDQAWASREERKRWWALVTELERIAKALRSVADGR